MGAYSRLPVTLIPVRPRRTWFHVACPERRHDIPYSRPSVIPGGRQSRDRRWHGPDGNPWNTIPTWVIPTGLTLVGVAPSGDVKPRQYRAVAAIALQRFPLELSRCQNRLTIHETIVASSFDSDLGGLHLVWCHGDRQVEPDPGGAIPLSASIRRTSTQLGDKQRGRRKKAHRWWSNSISGFCRRIPGVKSNREGWLVLDG